MHLIINRLRRNRVVLDGPGQAVYLAWRFGGTEL